MARCLQIIHTEAGNATLESGEWHGDGDVDDAGSEIYLLPLNDKGIHAEGLFLNLYWLRVGVTVAAEIMAVRVRVSVRGSYGGHLGWNPRVELALRSEQKPRRSRGCARGTWSQHHTSSPGRTEIS